MITAWFILASLRCRSSYFAEKKLIQKVGCSFSLRISYPQTNVPPSRWAAWVISRAFYCITCVTGRKDRATRRDLLARNSQYLLQNKSSWVILMAYSGNKVSTYSEHLMFSLKSFQRELSWKVTQHLPISLINPASISFRRNCCRLL